MIWEGGQDWPMGIVGALSAVNSAVQSRNNGSAQQKLYGSKCAAEGTGKDIKV